MDLSVLEGPHSLWFLIANVLLHELGVPVPMMPAVLLAGAQAASGSADPLGSIAAVAGTILIGNSVWFGAGRRYGVGMLNAVSRLPLLSERAVSRAEHAFRKWGGMSLIVGRFVPGLGLMAPSLAGTLRMTWVRFLTLTSIGATAYALVV